MILIGMLHDYKKSVFYFNLIEEEPSAEGVIPRFYLVEEFSMAPIKHDVANMEAKAKISGAILTDSGLKRDEELTSKIGPETMSKILSICVSVAEASHTKPYGNYSIH